MAKKTTKQNMTCGPGTGHCHCKALLAILIIVLTWLRSATSTWSKVVVTIAAALILLGSNHCMCKEIKK